MYIIKREKDKPIPNHFCSPLIERDESRIRETLTKIKCFNDQIKDILYF